MTYIIRFGRRYGFECIVSLFSICYLSIVAQSGYRGDDILNSIVYGKIYSGEATSIGSFTMHIINSWITESGRFFPFAFYMYYLFYAMQSLVVYKYFLILFTIMNSFLFSYFILLVTQNKNLSRLVFLLYPMVIPISFAYDNPYNAYHGLLQSVFFYNIVAMILFWKSHFVKKKYLVYTFLGGASICCLISLWTYEISYVFFVIYVWIARLLAKDKNEFLKYIGPICLVYFFAIFVYIFCRYNAISPYDGVKTVFVFKLVAITYLKQLIASFPGVTAVLLEHFRTKDIFPMINSSDFSVAILFMLLLSYLLADFGREHVILPLRIKRFLIGMAGVFLFVAPILVSISSKYQQEISWGSAWLPVYLESFGILIFLLLFMVKYKENVIFKSIFIVIGGIIIFFGIIHMRCSLNNSMNDEYYARQIETRALQMGILNSYTVDNQLYTFSDYNYAQVSPKDFYSAYTKRHIEAYRKKEIDEKNEGLSGFAIKTIAAGKNTFTVFGQLKNEHFWHLIMQPQIFIAKEMNVGAINFSYFDDQLMKIIKIQLDLSKLAVAAGGDAGQIYIIPYNNVFFDSIAMVDHFGNEKLVNINIKKGIYPLECNEAEKWHWLAQNGHFEVVNHSGIRRMIHLRATAYSAPNEYGTIKFSHGDNQWIYAVSSQGTPIDMELVIQPGINKISFLTDVNPLTSVADQRQLYIQLKNDNFDELEE